LPPNGSKNRECSPLTTCLEVSPSCGCIEMVRRFAVEQGLDVIVHEQPPELIGPYAMLAPECPHGNSFWCEPTDAQLTAWILAGVM
jgi:hypothetical protein